VIGFTNYHRTGNTVSVEYHLKGAIPNSTYTVELWAIRARSSESSRS